MGSDRDIFPWLMWKRQQNQTDFWGWRKTWLMKVCEVTSFFSSRAKRWMLFGFSKRAALNCRWTTLDGVMWGENRWKTMQNDHPEEIWLLVERALLARVGISWTRQKHEPLESNFLVNIAFFWVSILNLWGVAFCLSSVQDFDTQYPLVGTFPIFLYLDLSSSCPKSLVSRWKIAIIQESGQNFRVLYFKKPHFL